MKKITLLGSTGSIGTQSLDVIRKQGYIVEGLAAGKNINLLEKQIIEFKPRFAAVADEALAKKLETRIAGLEDKPVIFSGSEAAAKIVRETQADIVLNAIVGIAGLQSTLQAAKCGADIALANKESLVAGGSLVMDAVKNNNVKLLPVDSEHSAIFQCLQDKHSAKALEKIILTASGGPFFGRKRGELVNVTKEDALKHPNWDMGAKITIDSATLMNKGLEFIEAMYMFNMPPEKIEILVHRESIIHSLVQFKDNSVLAQLGVPDMRIPIQYALTYPQRAEGTAPMLDFTALSTLNFGQADTDTFTALAACKKAAEKDGLAACAANSANEEAVALFLQDKISFLDIGDIVFKCVESESYNGGYTIEDVYECDKAARAFVRAQI